MWIWWHRSYCALIIQDSFGCSSASSPTRITKENLGSFSNLLPPSLSLSLSVSIFFSKLLFQNSFNCSKIEAFHHSLSITPAGGGSGFTWFQASPSSVEERFGFSRCINSKLQTLQKKKDEYERCSRMGRGR